MKTNKYLFISRKSSHYKYYQKLVRYLGDESQLAVIKFGVFPRLKYLSMTNQLDMEQLVGVHIKRKLARYAFLKNSVVVTKLLTAFYRLLEKCRASYYFQLFLNNDVDTIVVCNGMKQPNKTPYEVAKLCGKNTMLFENGLLPNTTVLDPQGVNALNSLPRDPSFYMKYECENNILHSQLVVREPHKSRKVAAEQNQQVLPEKYVFVPFQVPSDTQIVCHSPWIDSMESFYSVIDQCVQSIESKLGLLPFKFVIKEHPSWPKSFTNLHFKNSNIIFANEHNTQQLIENSMAVLTINSTEGVEGLLLGKKVITLGDAFINIDGLVTHCNEIEALQNCLLKMEELPFNKELVTKFLTYLRNKYLIQQAWSSVTDDSTTHFRQVQSRLENSIAVG
ncbi:MAG: hypothetical protein HWE10_00510 [Gammaproteobacteria bacterium]|nr:hypothetical protein [Gammaproteobacteria bacterium]